MTSYERQERNRKYERRFHSVMLSLVAGGILWMLNIVVETHTSIANLSPRIQALEIQSAGAYRASDAKRDQEYIVDRFGQMDKRVSKLEKYHE